MSRTEQTQSTKEARERAQLQRQMAVKYGIDQAMNQLIEDMAVLVDDTEIADSRMEKHQLRNLLNVALDTLSGEVVKHYIYFQVGRDVSGLSWRHNTFGQELVKRLDDLKKVEARQIINQVNEALAMSGSSAEEEAASEENELNEVWILLIRAYLGQLNRYFYYKKEAKTWP